MMPPEGHLMDRYGDIAEAGCPSFTISQSIIGQVHSQSDPFVFERSGNALIAGGNWNNGANAGLSNLNNNDVGGNSNNGSRLNETMLYEKFTVIGTSPESETVKHEKFWLVPRVVGHDGMTRFRFRPKVIMHRIGNFWKDVVTDENILMASRKACHSRKNKDEVAAFLLNQEPLLKKLKDDLTYHTYETSEYFLFEKVENGKVRLVSDLPLYPDRIAHWAVALVVEPMLDGRLIPQTHASRKGHGAHSAIMNIKRYLDSDCRIQYALMIDVSKFFPTMPKDVAKNTVHTVIKDPDALWFIDKIIDDYPLEGIPLGNRLSPLIANLVLSYVLDYPMKQIHHCHYYVRYMDDVVVLGYSKQWLHKIRRIMASRLEESGMHMKDNWQVFPIQDRGIDFVGYRIYRDRILLRKSTKIRMVRKVTELQKLVDSGYSLNSSQVGTVASYDGILKWCDSRELRRKTIAPLVRSIESDRRWIIGLRSWRAFKTLYWECDHYV